ncbi:MAG: glycosyltransferase [Gammaproteobacteria bacterium]
MRRVDLSVVVPVGKRVDDLKALHLDYRQGLDACGVTYEMIYVLDGERGARFVLESLRDSGEPIKIIRLGKSFGEATALMVGFANADGARLMTLPAYFQIEGRELPKLVAAAADADLVVARRWPRRGGRFETVRRNVFHALLRLITRKSFRDLGCGARVMSRRVAQEITIYGDQHRLLPVLAAEQGFEVEEIDVAQSPRDDFRGRYRLREYLHRLLDLLTVFFLTRFTKKPLRFFGMIGSGTFAIGGIALAVLVAQRLLFGAALADRPAMLLACLMLVLGVQLFAIGLIGELIIFTHAKDLKDYRIADIVESHRVKERDDAGAELTAPIAGGSEQVHRATSL